MSDAWTRIAAAAGLFAFTLSSTPTRADFYDVELSALAGAPGTIIRAEPMTDVPPGANAYRVLYRSTGLQAEPIAVSAVIVVPAGPAPAGGRPVMAWAHGTIGVARACAPSLRSNWYDRIPGLEAALAQGYVVAATDYPGLGTVGPNPYLIGASEGKAVLDAVRAARALPAAAAGERFAVWGHSQGGHAALYAGALARSYAAELELIGIATAAPATDLVALFEDDIGTVSGKIIASMALWSWSQIYGLPLDQMIYPEAMPAFRRVAADCIESLPEFFALRIDEWPLRREFLKLDPTKVAAWRALMERNSPGPTPTGVPVFLAQSTDDLIVRPPVTERFVSLLCRHGITVRFLTLRGVSHALSGRDAAASAVAWIADRFSGVPAPSDCAAVTRAQANPG